MGGPRNDQRVLTTPEALGEKVSNTNFRAVLERKGLISGDSSGPEEGSSDSPKPQ